MVFYKYGFGWKSIFQIQASIGVNGCTLLSKLEHVYAHLDVIWKLYLWHKPHTFCSFVVLFDAGSVCSP